jgi:hypothetical protein
MLENVGKKIKTFTNGCNKKERQSLTPGKTKVA